MSGRHERAVELARRAGAEVLLLARPSSVTWLSGVPVDIEVGPSPFAVWPMLLLEPDGGLVAVASEDEAPAFEEAGCRVLTFPGFTLDPLAPGANARAALAEALAGRRAATETAWLSTAAAEGHDVVDVTSEVMRARAVKDADEIEKVRAAIRVCDVGQQAAREHARAGVSELELWAEIRKAMELAAGERIPVLADLVSGPRTEHVGGPPSERRIEEGDLVVCDLVPRVAGYWGDSCSTLAVGEPSAQARDQHRASREALARGVAALRPGVRAGDLDAELRAGLDYPHHTGHGLGGDFHEEPRVVPGSETVLEPGMVVALEPGLYANGSGVRCEQICVITDDGCEVLSQHDLEL
jgi:Xaa-Pro dipeptidase